MDNFQEAENTVGLRLGDVLVEQGLISEFDVKLILKRQCRSGKPFGEIAEAMCDISSEAIEEAWACQYAHNAPTIDPIQVIPRADARALISARQAWQFRCLPMNLEGNTLVIATTQMHLHRALQFATRVLDRPAYFVMTTEGRLAAALSIYYPLCGMSASLISGETINRLVSKMRIDRLREAS